MKKIQKLFCLLLSLAMMLCFAVPAYATDPTTYDLKINSKTPGHTYQAYQIFEGELATVPGSTDSSTDKRITLVNIVWGNGIKTNQQGALLAAIKAIKTGSEPAATTPFEDCNDAADVADVLAEYRNTPALVDAFAAVVGKKASDASDAYTYLDDAAMKSAATSGTGDTYSATIEGLTAGYYLIKEDEFAPGSNNAYTKYMLTVVQLKDNQEIDAKADVPTLDKKVAVGNVTAADETTATIGDTVTYTLTSTVPKMDGYNKYFFVIEDTLPEGLTLDPGSITVKIATSPETTLTKGGDYTVTTDPATVPGPDKNQKTSLKIVFTNFIQYNKTDYIGKEITVTYDAEVNKNALSGLGPNPNSAILTYSNDPNFKYEGKKDSPYEPDVGEPTGKTPPDVANVYTASIQINKTDKDDYPLTGAGFTLQYQGAATEPANTKAIVTTYGDGAFDVDNANGTYYKLKNGAFTTKVPKEDGSTNSLYDSTDTKYKKDDTQATKNEQPTVTNEMVGADGVLQLSGLKAGTYILTEATTPANYNTVDPITLTLTFTPADEEKGTVASWSGTYKIGEDKEEKLAVNEKTGVLSINVVNHAGVELPSTGGMGTTLFLYGGAGLMILALVLLVVRKKKNHDGE